MNKMTVQVEINNFIAGIREIVLNMLGFLKWYFKVVNQN
jgi:hypothetical protein